MNKTNLENLHQQVRLRYLDLTDASFDAHPTRRIVGQIFGIRRHDERP